MHKVVKASIIVATVVLISAIILYQMPTEIKIQSAAVSQSNPEDMVDVALSLTVWNYVFKPTQITGTITWNGVQYESMISMGYDVFESKGFIEKVGLKLKGVSEHLFVRADLKGQQIHMLEDTIRISQITNNSITLFKDNEDGGDGTYMIEIQ